MHSFLGGLVRRPSFSFSVQVWLCALGMNHGESSSFPFVAEIDKF